MENGAGRASDWGAAEEVSTSPERATAQRWPTEDPTLEDVVSPWRTAVLSGPLGLLPCAFAICHRVPFLGSGNHSYLLSLWTLIANHLRYCTAPCGFLIPCPYLWRVFLWKISQITQFEWPLASARILTDRKSVFFGMVETNGWLQYIQREWEMIWWSQEV